MFLLDVAAASIDVGRASARRAKIAGIARLLNQARPNPELVTIVASWLSGDLPQRQIGIGWAALRSIPHPRSMRL